MELQTATCATTSEDSLEEVLRLAFERRQQEKDYFEGLRQCIPQHNYLGHMIQQKLNSRQSMMRASQTGMQIDLDISSIVLQEDQSSNSEVFIIENIGIDSIVTLATACMVPYDFFVDFFANSEGPSVWEAVTSTPWRNTNNLKLESRQRHIEGVLPHIRETWGQREVRRAVSRDDRYGWQCSMRMSYHRMTANQCMLRAFRALRRTC